MIDYAAIAAAFADGFTVQTHGWPTLFDRMEKLLDRLEEQAGNAERATRAYPVLRYRDGAVGVRLAVGPIAPFADLEDAGRGVGEGLSEGARRFAAGFGWVGDAVTQELALPRFASVAVGMVAAVDASLARFDAARPSMFDARDRRFSDVFGLAGLGWRALQGEQNQDQLRSAATQFGIGAGFFRSLGGTSPADAASADATTSGVEALVGGLEEKAGLTMSALLLLPAASLTLDVLLTDGVLALQSAMLREFGTIEASIYDLRGQFVDAWLAAFDVGTTVHYLTSAADLVVRANTTLLGAAIPFWLGEFLDGVEGMLRGIQAWANWTSAIIRAFQVATTDLLAVDLMPWVVRNVLNDWIADHVPMPSVTLDDIVELLISGHPKLRDRIDGFLDKADDALWLADFVFDVADLRRKIAALRDIFRLTLTATPFTYPPDVLPSGPMGGFPDVYASFFGGTARAELLGAVRRAGTELQGSMHDIGTVGARLASGLAVASEAEMRRQTGAGAGLQLGQRWRSEGELVTGLFRPLREDLAGRAAGAPPEPLADAFDQAAGAGGILAAAEAVPAYVGALRRFWETRSTAREYPTSAHILARRGRLAMVRVPRLTMTAHERIAGAGLASEVADHFHDVVAAAYREGRARTVLLARPAHERAPAALRARVRGGARRGR